MADEFLTNLPVLTDVSGSVFYAVKGGTDYQVSIGDIQGSTQPQAANLVYAGPVTAPGDFPTFRPLVLADIPDLSSLYLASTGGSLSSATINNSNIVGGTISGATATFDDNKLTIRDQTDTTKKVMLEVSGVTTGTTRVLSVPDETTTLVGTTTAQTLTNKVVRTTAGTTANAPVRIPHGSAPTSPVNGDMWTTTAGVYVRINNSTVGPLAAATSSTVNSFNGRVGSVTLTSADVINALGYTPANVATAALDANVVHNTGNETIAGNKVFTSTVTISTVAPILAMEETDASTTTYLVKDSSNAFDVRYPSTSSPDTRLRVSNNASMFAIGSSDVQFGSNTLYHTGNFNPAGKMDTSWTLTAGNGLTGGGSGAANRTVTLGTPSDVTLASTSSVTTSSHSHAFTPGGTTAQYIRGNGTLATFPAIPDGTVTSITAGNGMNFTTITGSGSIILGTPSTLTGSTTNAVTSTSHTHAITVNLGISGTTGALTVTNSAGTTAVIPVATASASGLVSTGNQTWGGTKTAVNFVATSDARLKTNIRTRLPAERLADMLRFVEYMWKDSGEEAVGVIAQEVRSVAPEYVFEDENGMLAVDKAGLALECVIGLAARVRDLENK